MSVYPPDVEVRKGAVVSDPEDGYPLGRYRYRLTRTWRSPDLLGDDFGRKPWLPFIMLNPSTADAGVDDPTIRRCVGIAVREGYTGIAVLNLYAHRATKPAAMFAATGDIVGPDNERRLRNLLRWAKAIDTPVVAAWGVHARPERVRWLLDQEAADNLVCLGWTQAGQPRHPLMVKGDTPLVPWVAPC